MKNVTTNKLTSLSTKIAAVLLTLFAGASAFAGSANAYLNCKSANGQLAIKGWIPGDESNFTLEITEGQVTKKLFNTYTYPNGTSKNASITVMDSLKDGVWTMKSDLEGQDTYGYISMFALPKTMSYKNLTNGYRASFTAKATYNFKEFKNEDNYNVKVVCTLNYSL